MEKIAFGYGRVSTDEQANEGDSLANQEAKFLAWCEVNDYRPGGFLSDPGISGKRADNRPSLQRVLKLVTQHKAPLVVRSLSRLARSTKDTIEIGEQLEKSGANLVSLSEFIDTTTAAGKMFFRLMAVLAEFERDLVSERTAGGLRFLRQKGEAHTNAKYGWRKVQDGVYVRAKNADGGPTTWEPVQQEQDVIAQINAWRDLGVGYGTIATYLNDEGVPSPRGTKWHATSVRSVYLTSPKMPPVRPAASKV